MREKSGDAAVIPTSMFDAMAHGTAVPLMNTKVAQPPRRIGLVQHIHPADGRVKTKDGAAFLDPDPEPPRMALLAAQVLGEAALAADPAFATMLARAQAPRRHPRPRRQAMFGADDARRAPDAKPAASRHRLRPRQRTATLHRIAAAPHRGPQHRARGVRSRPVARWHGAPASPRRGAVLPASTATRSRAEIMAEAKRRGG